MGCTLAREIARVQLCHGLVECVLVEAGGAARPARLVDLADVEEDHLVAVGGAHHDARQFQPVAAHGDRFVGDLREAGGGRGSGRLDEGVAPVGGRHRDDGPAVDALEIIGE